MNCCDYECTRAPNCPAGSVVAQELLGTDPLPGLMTYDDAQKQWRRSDFQPLFNTPEPDDEQPDESILTPVRVLIGCGVFLAGCVLVTVLVLNIYR